MIYVALKDAFKCVAGFATRSLTVAKNAFVNPKSIAIAGILTASIWAGNEAQGATYPKIDLAGATPTIGNTNTPDNLHNVTAFVSSTVFNGNSLVELQNIYDVTNNRRIRSFLATGTGVLEASQNRDLDDTVDNIFAEKFLIDFIQVYDSNNPSVELAYGYYDTYSTVNPDVSMRDVTMRIENKDANTLNFDLTSPFNYFSYASSTGFNDFTGTISATISSSDLTAERISAPVSIANFSISAVPEPSSLAFIAGGAGVYALHRRRRTKQNAAKLTREVA